MPKHNLFFKPGEALPEDIEKLLIKHFKMQDLVKLEKFGGRVQISITAPFTDRKAQKDVDINEVLIKSLKSDTTKAQKILSTFTKKQLQELAGALNIRTASAWTTKEILRVIIQSLQAPEQWRGIGGE